MKRRDFIVKGAFALGAIATSDLWIGNIVAGESTMLKSSLLDTYFRISQEEIKKVLTACLAKGADFADVFLNIVFRQIFLLRKILSNRQDAESCKALEFAPSKAIRSVSLFRKN